MVVAGAQPWWFMIIAGALTVTVAAGSIPIAGGIGTRITHGALRSITDVGFVIRGLAGAGIQTPNGRPLG